MLRNKRPRDRGSGVRRLMPEHGQMYGGDWWGSCGLSGRRRSCCCPEMPHSVGQDLHNKRRHGHKLLQTSK